MMYIIPMLAEHVSMSRTGCGKEDPVEMDHKVCQHMVTAFILAASGSHESKKKAGANFELAERRCRHCGSTDAA